MASVGWTSLSIGLSSRFRLRRNMDSGTRGSGAIITSTGRFGFRVYREYTKNQVQPNDFATLEIQILSYDPLKMESVLLGPCPLA